jgi:hypothetical protein
MTLRISGTLRRCLAGSALGGLITFTAVPAAMAQWLPPWRAASPGYVEQRLEAQGYLLIAPLQRRPTVYLADVSAGPGGYQRLVIDAWSGTILQRFVAPPRRWGPVLAARDGEFAAPALPGFVGPGPSGGFSTMPNTSSPAKSAYGGPSNVHIPSAISPFGSPEAPSATKPKPKSNATTPNKVPETKPTAASPAAAPLPPAAPPEARPDAPTAPNAPGNQDSDKPNSSSPPTEVETAPPASREGAKDDASTASLAATPELKQEAPKTEPQPEPQRSATAQSATSAPQPAAKPASPDSSVEPIEKSKVNIVPSAAFE